MLILLKNKFCSLVLILSVAVPCASSTTSLPIRMPEAKPPKDDAYLCTSIKLPSRDQYIVRFEPKGDPKVAHHMLLFGCDKPGSSKPIWDCDFGQECAENNNILFAWANGASAKDLPKDVGFKVGKSAQINYIVLQVHYRTHKDVKDDSGFVLHTTPKRQPYLAGIFLLWGSFVDIPPEAKGVHSDIVCQYQEKTTMYAFAYRTHAHSLGKVITGYKVNHNNWTLLGRGNPQAPQAFFPMDKIHKISKGDKLAARCTYDSKGHHLKEHVHIGGTHEDEMCNFYIMYYRDANDPEIYDPTCDDSLTDQYALTFPTDSDMPLKSKTHMQKTKTDTQKTKTHTQNTKTHTQKTKTKVHTTQSPKHKESDTHTTIKTIVPKHQHKTPGPTLPKHRESHSHGHASSKHQDISHLMGNYRIVDEWPKLGKDHLGQVSGVAVDSQGLVIIFHRGKRKWDMNSFDENNVFNEESPIRESTVLTLDPNTGKVVGRWGRNKFYLPHGITVDHHDNIWLTDVGTHQVFKYPSNGGNKPLLSLGEQFVPDTDKNHFCKPTDVAVEKSGSFYVADGYCNSRIMKFSADGKYINEWGQYGISKGAFDIPHSITLDEASHRLYIADRQNGRIQSLDTNTGIFDEPINNQHFGLVFAVDFNSHSGLLHAINGNNDEKSAEPMQGFTIRPSDGHLLQTWPTGKQHFTHPHDVISSADDVNLYVVEINPCKVWKLTKRTSTNHHGDKNRFPGICQLDKDSGPCRAAMPRWYFDVKALTCKRFIYGGCSGNGNNFMSKRECETKCGHKDVNSNKSKNITDDTGRMSEMALNSLHSNEDNKRTNVLPSLPTTVKNSIKPTEHETDDWQNAAGEDEGDESNLHAASLWKQHHNTSTNQTTPRTIKKNQSKTSDNITGGMIPALIILSVLAVPIVFLLLISIALRIRAYRRDTRYKTNRLLKTDKDGLAVGRTRGWWSYLNCFKRQTYGFDKVNMAEFYSDSDSDGV